MPFAPIDCTDRQALAAAAATRIAERLRRSIEETGRASLVVPGGTTPIAVFNALTEMPLAWDKVTIIPCDERWVPRDHSDSNEGLIHRHLLRGKAAKAQILSLYRQQPTPVDAMGEVSAALQGVPRPFSIVFLGMGEDGHFASLFPDRAETTAALDLDNRDSIMTLREPAKGHPRIGLTLSALVDTPLVLLAVTGDEKRIVLERAIANINDDTLPVAALLRQTQTPIDILLSV